MDRVNEAEMLLAVAAAGSLSAAARARGQAQSTLTRALEKLEARLGVRLLERSTRRLAFTTAGQTYLVAARRFLAEANALETEPREAGRSLRGRLCISMCPTFARRYLVGPSLEWAAAHPEIELELRLEERVAEVGAGDVDVAVRVGRLGDSRLRARRLAQYGHLLVASPDYLSKQGVPGTPEDLRTHQCIVLRTDRLLNGWTFQVKGRPLVINVKPTTVTSDAEILLQAAAAGVGITVLPDFLCEELLRERRLVSLLPAYPLPARHIAAVYPAAGTLKPSARDWLRMTQDALAQTLRLSPSVPRRRG